MRVALFQFDPRFGEVDANLDIVEQGLAREARADLWVLPELFATGYDFVSAAEALELAETLEGPTFERARGWCRELGCAVAYGFAEVHKGRVYNSAAIVDATGVRLHYRKLHLFAREKLFFEPGDLPLRVIEIAGTRCGLMICFDWRFPETARSLAFLGADLLAHPSNLVLPWCPDAMIVRALENNVYVATCDRWGIENRNEERLRFIGRSQVVSPTGERLAQLGEEESGWIAADVNPALARNKQVSEHNHLFGDRRTKFYVDRPSEARMPGS